MRIAATSLWGKVLDKGIPCPPLLFNLAIDVFTRILNKAAKKGLIEGLLTNVFEGGIISLQYADDTLLFLKNDVTKAAHFMWLLAWFENLS